MHYNAHILREERKQAREVALKRKEEILASDEERSKWLLQLLEQRKVLLLNAETRQRLKEDLQKRGNQIAQRRMQIMAEMDRDDDKAIKTKGDNDEFELRVGDDADE